FVESAVACRAARPGAGSQLPRSLGFRQRATLENRGNIIFANDFPTVSFSRVARFTQHLRTAFRDVLRSAVVRFPGPDRPTTPVQFYALTCLIHGFSRARPERETGHLRIP